jgi:hypothetical protein
MPHKLIYHCFYCGAKVFFDDAVRSEKTNKRLPLNIEDSTKHECAAFYSVHNRAACSQAKQLFFGK